MTCGCVAGVPAGGQTMSTWPEACVVAVHPAGTMIGVAAVPGAAVAGAGAAAGAAGCGAAAAAVAGAAAGAAAGACAHARPGTASKVTARIEASEPRDRGKIVMGIGAAKGTKRGRGSSAQQAHRAVGQ